MPTENASTDVVDLDAYDYELPPERIAQVPADARDEARLLVLPRAAAGADVRHAGIRDLPKLLEPGDLLVLNATRVLPARLVGRKRSGGRAEALLLGPRGDGSGAADRHFRALVRCRGRLRVGLALEFDAPGEPLGAEIEALSEDGSVTLVFDSDRSPYEAGRTPLPPYIRREPESDLETTLDRDRYQTVFARVPGSVAAPTAGLHWTRPLLDAVAARGVEIAEVVLHVGVGTFRPPGPADLARGTLHPERYELSPAVADAVAATRARGGRVAAVGTTTTRVLESCADAAGRVRAGSGETDLFLRPGSRFRVVDALLTNFHLPRSSLLLLVAAFAGRERVLAAYRSALAAGYRFYSYGDAMWIA